MTPDTTQTRYRLRDAEKAADNTRRMKEFGYRWLAFSGAVKPGPRRLSPWWDGVVGCVLFVVAIAVVAGAGIAMGW